MVFVFNHTNRTRNITTVYNRINNICLSVISLNSTYRRDFIISNMNCPVFHKFFKILCNSSLKNFPLADSGSCNNMVVIHNRNGKPAAFVEHLGILACKIRQLTNRRIFFKNNFSLRIGKNF